MEKPSSNGHHPDEVEAPVSVNPYVDVMIGDRPREIAEFELHTDPYANMIPRARSVTGAGNVDDAVDGRRRNPWVVAISLVLIVILVLPVMVEVFARLIH